MKYNLATIINKLGMKTKNNSIHKVRTTVSSEQSEPRATSYDLGNSEQEKQTKDRARSNARCILTHTETTNAHLG